MKNKLIRLSIVVALLLCGIEVFTRVVAFSFRDSLLQLPPRMSPRADISPSLRPDGHALGAFLRDVDSVAIEFTEFPHHIVFNNEGFRSNIPHEKQKKTILCLGASYAYGVYIHNEDIFSSWLQGTLERSPETRGKYQVMNASVPGRSMAESTAFIREKDKLLGFPELIVQISVTEFGVSNQGAGVDFLDRQGFLQSVLKKVKDHVACLYVLNKMKNAIVNKKSAALLADKSVRISEADRSFMEIIYGHDKDKSAIHWNQYEQQMANWISENNIDKDRLHFLVFPDGWQVFESKMPDTPQKEVRSICEKLGVHMIDTLPYLREAGDWRDVTLLRDPIHQSDLRHTVHRADLPLPIEVHTAGDGHFSRRGHRAISEAIAASGIFNN